jgi:hypothetical protein
VKKSKSAISLNELKTMAVTKYDSATTIPRGRFFRKFVSGIGTDVAIDTPISYTLKLSQKHIPLCLHVDYDQTPGKRDTGQSLFGPTKCPGSRHY